MFSSTNSDVAIIGERSARISAYLLCRILSIIGNVTALVQVLLPISGTTGHI